MLDLAAFVLRLKQAIAWNMSLSQSPVEFIEYTKFNDVDSCKQALDRALLHRDSQGVVSIITSRNFRELGRILCIEVADDASDYDNIWFLEERVAVLIDTWFALDEFPQNREALLYSWIPSAFELSVQQAISSESPGKLFWRDQRPTMFYNAVILAMAKPE